MSQTKPDNPDLCVVFGNGDEAGWHNGEFFGCEKRVSRAEIRVYYMLHVEIKGGFVLSSNSSAEGALVALLGDTDLSLVEITSAKTILLTPSPLIAGLGSWH